MFLIRQLSSKCKQVKYFVRFNSHDANRKGSGSDKKLILYGDEVSPPVRAVLMTASMLKVDYKFHEIDLFCSEHKTEFYAKINPLQKVPSLAVGDHNVICDSHAIMLYLSRKSKNNLLYPDDPSTKAQIDQMMYFNSGSLFPVDNTIYTEYFTGKWPANEKLVNEWYRSLDYLELRLEKRPFLAGGKVFLCDISCGATVSSLELLLPFLDRHEHVKKWMARLNELDCFEINARGLKRLNVFVEKMKTIF